jgi:hypothetical protein
MQKPQISPLKVISFALGLVGMVVASEVSRRETDELVTTKVNDKIAELSKLVELGNSRPAAPQQIEQ